MLVALCCPTALTFLEKIVTRSYESLPGEKLAILLCRARVLRLITMQEPRTITGMGVLEGIESL